jgi:hypothetical protein
MMVHACDSSYSGGQGKKMASLRPTQTKLEKPCLKSKTEAWLQ